MPWLSFTGNMDYPMHGSTSAVATTIRNRKGRKRREGKRYASGDLVREIATPPAAIRRLRDAALAGMQDARWGTELGRLYLNDRLTSEQYNAGCRWEALAIRYNAALGAKSSLPSVSDFGRTSGAPVDPDSDAGLLEAKRQRADMARYREAFVVLARQGHLVTRAVRELCEDGAVLDSEGFAHAITGLNALAADFGLTNRKK